MQLLQDAVTQWLNQSSKQCYVIKGAAGTGKTHCLLELQNAIPNSITVSFTNKAVKVILSRGGEAHTIHSSFYQVIPTGKFKTIYTPKISSITHQIEKDYNGNTVLLAGVEEICEYSFEPAAVFRKGISSMSDVVVIVDEASMVPIEILYEFFENTNYRYIFIGDHNQLPPVNPDYDELNQEIASYLKSGLVPNSDSLQLYTKLKQYDKFFENAIADYTLVINHRQASGSIINVVSDSVLNMGTYPTNLKVSGLVDIVDMYKDKVSVDDLMPIFAASAVKSDIIIAWKNTTCSKINSRVRSVLHANEFALLEENQYSRFLAGDKLYVQSNYKLNDMKISKGSFIYVEKIIDYDYLNNLALAECKIDDDNTTYLLTLDQGYCKTRIRGISAVNVSFGFCITAHKSQGSQWDGVMVIDEGIHFDRKRWLYTAITRAKRGLTIINGDIK